MSDTLTAAAPAAAADRLPPVGRLLARQVGYQLRLLARNPRALWLSLLAPGLLLALRIGRVSHGGGTSPALTAAVAGLSAFGLIGTCYITHAIGLTAARQDGVLRRWRSSPLPRWGYFAGRIIATMLLGIGSGAVIVGVGVGMAGIHLSAGAVLALVILFLMAAAAWAAVGTAVTALIPTAQGANPILLFTYLPMILFSGGFGSINGLPHWLGTLMSYLPGEPLIDGAAKALQHTGGGLAPMSARDLGVLAAWAVIGLLASIRFFRWDPTRPAHARR